MGLYQQGDEMRCTPSQLRILDNLASGRDIDNGFNRSNGFDKSLDSLRAKGLIDRFAITKLGLKMIGASCLK